MIRKFDKRNVRYVSEKLFNAETMETFIRLNNSTDFEDVTPAEAKIYERVSYFLRKMESYGENRWWDSNDTDAIAYWQMKEVTLFVLMEEFRLAIENLLARPISIFELFIKSKDIEFEVEKIYLAKNKTPEKSEETKPDFD